jgi:hypothetical protein
MGPAGYVDDVVVAAAVLHTVMRTVDQRIVDLPLGRARAQLLDTIRTILASAEELVGSGVWERIKRTSSAGATAASGGEARQQLIPDPGVLSCRGQAQGLREAVQVLTLQG